ncbi:hypothetical protein AVEN_128819-1 [Araneus ventricosus]|uniref:Uncharacterized protein n=1 Tax=Araneus ventricosus TaxID=182803 RepID=A0A4Y2K5S1_ARAVE|nr:hypothetical protein AVEN_128819-1 [Araneus ventricosus]
MTGTDPDTRRRRLSNARSDVLSAIVQDTSTSGEHEPPSIPFQAAGNYNYSPDASEGPEASSMLPGTDPDTAWKRLKNAKSVVPSAIAQNASTSAGDQPTTISFQLTIFMENTRKNKDSPVATHETASSLVLTETDPDTPRRCLTNARSDVSHCIVQGASTSGEHQPPSIPFQATGNHNHSPDASDGMAASSVLTGTDSDAQSAIEQDASTSGESQPPSMNILEQVCMLYVYLSFRRWQIQHYPFSSGYRVPDVCNDEWIKNAINVSLRMLLLIFLGYIVLWIIN